MSKEEKLQSFKKHDFDGDEKWVAYFKNVEVPSGDIGAAKLKLQAKWYKKNVDNDFEVEWVTSSSSSSSYTPPPASRATYTAPPQQQQPGSAGTGSTSGPRAAPQQAGDATSGTQRRLFFLHAALILTGVFSAVPFVPYARFLYTTFLKLAVVCHGFKLYLKAGLPVLRPFAWANIMAWAAKVVPTTDMFHFLCSLIFMSHPPALMLTVPILVLAGYHAMAYASQHFAGTMLWRRYGAKFHAMMMERQHDAMQLNAFSEVSLGLVLIVQLLTPQRNLLLLFFYWNMLKARYHAPSDTCWQHQQAWRSLDNYTSSWRQRLPILNTPINLVKRWFLAVPQARA